jgi:hypothetical protein
MLERYGGHRPSNGSTGFTRDSAFGPRIARMDADQFRGVIPNAEINWIEFGNQEIRSRSEAQTDEVKSGKKFKTFLNPSVGIRAYPWFKSSDYFLKLVSSGRLLIFEASRALREKRHVFSARVR